MYHKTSSKYINPKNQMEIATLPRPNKRMLFWFSKTQIHGETNKLCLFTDLMFYKFFSFLSFSLQMHQQTGFHLSGKFPYMGNLQLPTLIKVVSRYKVVWRIQKLFLLCKEKIVYCSKLIPLQSFYCLGMEYDCLIFSNI